jgi:hypothetical protein
MGKEIGMAKAIDHAESDIPGWGDLALHYVERFVRSGVQRHGFTAMDIRHWAYEAGLPAAPTNWAWGSVMRRAARQGLIAKGATRPQGDATAHLTDRTLWYPMTF